MSEVAPDVFILDINGPSKTAIHDIFPDKRCKSRKTLRELRDGHYLIRDCSENILGQDR